MMVSFDIPEEDDLTEAHILLEDGTLQYTSQSRSGMLFHPYDREAIEELTKDYNVVYKAEVLEPVEARQQISKMVQKMAAIFKEDKE